MKRDVIQAIGLLGGFSAVSVGAYLAWGLGYSLLIGGFVMLSAVLRARSFREVTTGD